MKLTIDTKEDSHDEIRKAIKMLATIVGDEHIYSNSAPKQHNSNIFESSSSTIAPSSEPSGSIFGNIFGDSSSSSPAQQPEEKKEEEEEKPQIIIEY